MMNIAVVGAGTIGISHIKAIEASGRCRLCALCDVNEEKAKKLAEEYGVEYFNDYRQIPEKTDADAVILNLPHCLHCESTVFFLNSGIHVLVEKPMANTVAECDKMLEAAKKNNRRLAVGHVQRFFEANRAVKEYIKSGALGRLCMYTEFRTVDYFNPERPRWFLSKSAAGGGIVMNYGAHALDKLMYVLGERDISVEACMGNYKNDAEIEGHAQIFLKLNGVSAAITFSGYSPSGYDAIYYFTGGALKVADSGSLSVNTDGTWQRLELDEDFSSAMSNQLEEFCKYVNGEAADIATGEYGRRVICTIEQIYKNL